MGIRNDYAGLEYFIPEDQEFPTEILPDEFRNGYVAIVLAGTYATKRLPAEKHLEIISKTNLPFILVGGDNERPQAEEILKHTKGSVFSLCGKLSINESASIVKDARLVIANDTGLMHIAAAFKKKIISIWGSTTPELGMFPYLPDPDSKMQRTSKLKCQPCSKIGKHSCPKNHFNCMIQQDTTEISDWLKQNY